MPSSLSCKWRWGPGEGGLAGETQGHVQLQRPGPARERAPARPLPSRGSLTQEASSPDWDSQGHLPVTSSDRVVDPAAEGAGPAVSPGSLPPPDLLSGAHAPAIPARPACTQRQDREFGLGLGTPPASLSKQRIAVSWAGTSPAEPPCCFRGGRI